MILTLRRYNSAMPPTAEEETEEETVKRLLVGRILEVSNAIANYAFSEPALSHGYDEDKYYSYLLDPSRPEPEAVESATKKRPAGADDDGGECERARRGRGRPPGPASCKCCRQWGTVCRGYVKACGMPQGHKCAAPKGECLNTNNPNNARS